MSLMTLAEWLESTWVAMLVRESPWGFPIVVAIHILGLTLSVGLVVWFDLRLLGVCLRGVPVSLLYRRLMPWLAVGFLVMFVTGGMLLAGYAGAAFENTYFRIKAAALVLAGVNALVYHLATERSVASWTEAARPPLPARMAGLASITLWAAIILAGRMMSYTMF